MLPKEAPPVGAEDGPGTVVLLVVDQGGETVLARLDGLCIDLALVDALARLQLAARRRGCPVRLHAPCRELADLLDLTGLTDVMAGGGVLTLEVGRQAEDGEELGPEEVVEPRDPGA
jgi:hypothetical protein